MDDEAGIVLELVVLAEQECWDKAGRLLAREDSVRATAETLKETSRGS